MFDLIVNYRLVFNHMDRWRKVSILVLQQQQKTTLADSYLK